MDIDNLWTILRIQLIKQEGDIYRYHYVFDLMDDYDGGIIEMDQDVLNELRRDISFNELFYLFADRRIEVIKTVKNKKFYNNDDIDVSLVIAIKFIRQYFLKNDIMPERIELLNSERLEKIRGNISEGFDKIISEIKED